MRGYLAPAVCGVFLCVSGIVTDATAQAGEIEVHVSAARAAVRPGVENSLQPFHVFDGLFDQMCAEPTLPDQIRQQDRSVEMSWSEWYLRPVRLFDNLYSIGAQDYPVYAVNTSEGVVVIDPGFDYNSEDLVLNLLRFGVEPENLRYIIVSDALIDRYSGASVLQRAYPSARVVMSETAWEVVAGDNNPQELKPTRDMVVTDGQALTLGGRHDYVLRYSGADTGHAFDDYRTAVEQAECDFGRGPARGCLLGRRGHLDRPAGSPVFSGRRDYDEHLGGFDTAVQGNCRAGRSRHDPHAYVQPREHSGEGARVENHESDCNARCRKHIWRLVF